MGLQRVPANGRKGSNLTYGRTYRGGNKGPGGHRGGRGQRRTRAGSPSPENLPDPNILQLDFDDLFDTLSDAIGIVPPQAYKVIGNGSTTAPGIIQMGYTHWYQVQKSDGTIVSVFFNPTTNKWAGSHLSSAN